MDVSEREPGSLVVEIGGQLDLDTATGIEAQVNAILARPATVVALDLTRLEFMDSSGITLLLRLTNHFGPLEVLGARAIIRRIIEVTGLAGVLKCEPPTE
jgi:anti-sigma B factor antagonist